ncbi:MAG: hypothetical protein IJT98_01380 [Prevotella sp.]|nr:hypothetical protein [Prevotella sp.]
MLSNLPADINIEVLLPYLPKGQYKVALNGLHKRNTYQDVMEMEDMHDGTTKITVGRNSIYNSLPEYMFHPIDRFDNLPKYEEKERFQEQMELQEAEIGNAYRFFAPIDVLLLKLHTDVHSALQPLADDDIVMQQVIGDNLTEEQRSNRFIRQIIPFLPYSKHIRGNSTLITMLLRKVFMEEGLHIDVANIRNSYTDEEPHYEQQLDMTLGDSYVGNTYYEHVKTYDIKYWSDDEAGPGFPQFVSDLEVLRGFIKDWFLAIEEDIKFNVSHDEPPLRLADDVFYNYLGYNTNI